MYGTLDGGGRMSGESWWNFEKENIRITDQNDQLEQFRGHCWQVDQFLEINIRSALLEGNGEQNLSNSRELRLVLRMVLEHDEQSVLDLQPTYN